MSRTTVGIPVLQSMREEVVAAFPEIGDMVFVSNIDFAAEHGVPAKEAGPFGVVRFSVPESDSDAYIAKVMENLSARLGKDFSPVPGSYYKNGGRLDD